MCVGWIVRVMLHLECPNSSSEGRGRGVCVCVSTLSASCQVIKQHFHSRGETWRAVGERRWTGSLPPVSWGSSCPARRFFSRMDACCSHGDLSSVDFHVNLSDSLVNLNIQFHHMVWIFILFLVFIITWIWLVGSGPLTSGLLTLVPLLKINDILPNTISAHSAFSLWAADVSWHDAAWCGPDKLSAIKRKYVQIVWLSSQSCN